MTAGIRPDASRKVRGDVEFGVDSEVPGMLWACLVGAPLPHGTLREVDLSAARSRPGVVAIGPEDLPTLLEGRAGDPDRPIFPRVVSYPGQPIAAVAAPTLAAARAAALLVRPRIEARETISDVESVFPDWPASAAVEPSRVAGHVLARRGNVDGELARADHVVRETYRTAGVLQVPLEPHACVASAADGRWSVTTSTQTPFGTREDTASLLGIPENDLIVTGTWVGGGFGGKGAALLEPYALLLSKAAGRPVRLALPYRDEFQLSRSTLPLVVRFETGVTAGRIVARRIRLLLDVGASPTGRDSFVGYAMGFLLGPYVTGVFEAEGYAVRTHKPPLGPHRAPLAPQCAFALESHLDEVARTAGVKPGDFRGAHLWSDGGVTAFGQKVGPFGIGAALRAAQERARAWRSALPAGHGVGIGLGFWSTAVGAGGEARVVLGPEALRIVQGEREIGSASIEVGLAAVAQRHTGLPRERIHVEYRATSEAPFDSGVFGSRTVAALGSAVVGAVDAVAREFARRLGTSGPVEFEVQDGEIVARAGGQVHRLRELLGPDDTAVGGIVGAGKYYAPEGKIDESCVVDGSFFPYSDFAGAAHVAEVSVDRETGTVRVERYAAFQDVGTVIDLATARAQVEGAVVMGLGTALTEETIWSADGRLANPGLLDYRIPTLGEAPPLDVTFVEGFAGAGPFGAKGLGEPPIIPVPATVAAAIRDACGAHLTELPLSAERVARALKRGRTSPGSDAARPR